jgi:hypothetical protein
MLMLTSWGQTGRSPQLLFIYFSQLASSTLSLGYNPGVPIIVASLLLK